MSGQDPGDAAFISKNRLEALVDGVFAFAMTLLVISLTVPSIPKSRAAAELAPALLSMWPELLSFLIAFFVLASFWVVHHRHFHYLNAVDTPILWLNIVILIFVVLVPFTTNVSGDYSDVQIAVILFHLNLLMLGLLFFIQWQYLVRHPTLAGTIPIDLTPKQAVDRIITPLAACVGIALSFYSPAHSMWSYLVVPLCVRTIRWIRLKI